MPPIINAQGLAKAFGAVPLFEEISFTISDGDRIALIGPNGSGKSTLLRILAGLETSDRGELACRKRVRLSYVVQDSKFAPALTVRAVVEQAMEAAAVPSGERGTRFAETLGRAGFEDLEVEAVSLSGGWQKRLAIVEALVQGPDILLLDEPTNHLDLAGIEWLEEVLRKGSFACVVVSHDRYFLENIATEIVELNRAYPNGLIRVRGTYTTFLEKKEEFLHSQAKRQESLENLVHNEIEWLRRGAKARTRKSKARIDKAFELMGFGRSSKPIIPYNFHDMAANSRKLLQSLGVAKVTIVGHSMGGMLAARFAASFPDIVERAVIYDPIGLTDPRFERPWRTADEAYKATMAQTNDQRYQGFYANIRRYFPTPGAWKPEYEQYARILYAPTLSGDWPRLAMVRSIYQQITYLDPVVYDWPKIKVKTLVLGGEKDGQDFPRLAKHIADTIPGAELAIIPNAGHVPHLEVPDLFYKELLKFLK